MARCLLQTLHVHHAPYSRLQSSRVAEQRLAHGDRMTARIFGGNSVLQGTHSFSFFALPRGFIGAFPQGRSAVFTPSPLYRIFCAQQFPAYSTHCLRLLRLAVYAHLGSSRRWPRTPTNWRRRPLANSRWVKNLYCFMQAAAAQSIGSNLFV